MIHITIFEVDSGFSPFLLRQIHPSILQDKPAEGVQEYDNILYECLKLGHWITLQLNTLHFVQQV